VDKVMSEKTAWDERELKVWINEQVTCFGHVRPDDLRNLVTGMQLVPAQPAATSHGAGNWISEIRNFVDDSSFPANKAPFDKAAVLLKAELLFFLNKLGSRLSKPQPPALDAEVRAEAFCMTDELQIVGGASYPDGIPTNIRVSLCEGEHGLDLYGTPEAFKRIGEHIADLLEFTPPPALTQQQAQGKCVVCKSEWPICGKKYSDSGLGWCENDANLPYRSACGHKLACHAPADQQKCKCCETTPEQTAVDQHGNCMFCDHAVDAHKFPIADQQAGEQEKV